ncbi:MAG: hypothetical protein ACOY30_02930 [Bacillota bacterium]
MKPFFMAIDRHRFNFLSLPGVVSIGLGPKIRRNFNTGIPSLIIGVKKKLPASKVPRDQMIPGMLDHLPTDVIETGRIKLLGYAIPQPQQPPEEQGDLRKQRMRPAQPGVSIGHYRTTAGTFGALVKGNFPAGVAILSNNHILANETSGRDGLSSIGDAVLQPGPYDNGTTRDTIARLYAFSPMLPVQKGGNRPVNRVDAALALPLNTDLVSGEILELGKVTGTARAFPGMTVFKSGRSTGITSGPVVSVGNTIRVDGEERTYIYEDQIGFNAKSDGGDSGALVVDRNGRAVGLLFAGSENTTFANPIQSVLDYFGVTLYQ